MDLPHKNTICDAFEEDFPFVGSQIKDLANYQIRLNEYEEVWKYEGGFCLAVPLDEKNRNGQFKRGLRIWINKNSRTLLPGIKERTQLVSQWIQQTKPSYCLNYEYYDRVLQVNNEWQPGIFMAWDDADTMAKYLRVQGNKSKTVAVAAIKKVRENFLLMCRDMQNKKIAHGDLSPENILVHSNGSLMLIDYDSMYVPSMGSRFVQNVAGTIGFRHPKRAKTTLRAGVDNDNFSQQIIYLMLGAYELHPEWIKEYDDRNTFFKEGTMGSAYAFQQSEAYKKIKALKDAKLDYLLQQLEEAVVAPVDKVKGICQVLDEMPSPQTLAEWCGRCGYHFIGQEAGFCPHCGRQRAKLA